MPRRPRQHHRRPLPGRAGRRGGARPEARPRSPLSAARRRCSGRRPGARDLPRASRARRPHGARALARALAEGPRGRLAPESRDRQIAALLIAAAVIGIRQVHFLGVDQGAARPSTGECRMSCRSGSSSRRALLAAVPGGPFRAPAGSLTDHDLRSHGDAVDLFRDLESEVIRRPRGPGLSERNRELAALVPRPR